MAHKRPVLAHPLALAAALSVALLPACGSTSYRTVVQVNPADASLYINGKRVGTGDQRPYLLSFEEYDRVYVQATKRGFVPETQVYTADGIADILDTTGILKITLSERR
jgi:hypothetical protein